MPKESNATFVYKIQMGQGSTLDEARKNCLGNLLEDAGLSKGLSVTSDYTSFRSKRTETHNNKKNTESTREFQINTSVKGKEVNLQGFSVDEYWEKRSDGSYHLSTLYARSRIDETPRFDDVKLTTNYGVQGLWRSAIVPGWGQLYKGSTVKGGCIMGATVLSIGAIVYTDCMRESYTSKISKTHNMTQKKAYADKRTAFATGRNICIGALCAVYVYNIVDAIVAPGARRVLTSPAGSNKFSYFWTPAVTDDNALGIVASINF